MNAPARAALLALFFLSGVAALVYEVAWVRSLTLVLGASHQAVSIVLASYMAGLAIGAAAFWALRRSLARPLRVYAIFELGIAASALLLPAVLATLDATIVGDAWWVRVLVSFATLLVPTSLMGATLPALVELVTRTSGDLPSRVPALYATNTLGACVGCLSCGFVLLPTLGLQATQWVAILLNVAVGGLAWALDRRVDVRAANDVEARAIEPIDARTGTLALRLSVASTVVAGAASLGLETLWTRAISVTTGTSTYAFTVMLAAFLSGIACGSAIRVVARFRSIPISRQLGLAFVLLGITSALASHWIPVLPDRVVAWNILFYGGARGARIATLFLAAYTVMAVPAILFGAAFPMAAQAAGTLASSPRRATAAVLVLNTAGAVAGPLLAGFVLVPAFGLQRTMLGAAALLFAYGLVVLAAESGRARPVRIGLALAAGAAAFAAVRIAPTWDPHLLGGF